MSVSMRMLTISLPVLAILAAACGGTTPDGADRGRIVSIEMTDFAFSPPTVTLKPGERVTFLFKNVGTVEHEFMAGAGAIATKGYRQDWLALARLEPASGQHGGGHAGEGVRVVPRGTGNLTILVPPLAGEFEFGCFVEGHYASGMKGTLIVDAGRAPQSVPVAPVGANPATIPTGRPVEVRPAPSPIDGMEGMGH